MPKVFIPQETLRWDKTRECMRPAFDISPAAAFGDLEVVFEHNTDLMLATAPMERRAGRMMQAFNDADYVMFMGSPNAITACIRAAHAANQGRMKQLVWDREQRRYIAVQFGQIKG